MRISIIVIALQLVFVFAQEKSNNNNGLGALLGPFRRFKLEAFDMLYESVLTNENMELLRTNNKLQKFIKNRKLPCRLNNTRSHQVPSSVHALRPGDISVIAGIGDSLTAGVGLMATNALQVVLEHRGIALSAGGEGTWRSYLTLPNILKTFNSKLTGYATSTSLTLHRESQLNVGETGAVSEDTPYMTRLLVKRMKSHPEINIEKDWKMITFMIGPNDFCSQVCYKPNTTEILENHRRDLQLVLRTLRDNLPRTIVNVIPPPNLRILTEFTGKSRRCEVNHVLECPCLFGPQTSGHEQRYRLFGLMQSWQEIDAEICNSDEFDSDDFTVVVQPFTLNFSLPVTEPEGLTDYSFLSEDCFHFSQRGNAIVANSLWNNILEPVGKKSRNFVEKLGSVKCPSKEHPFIFTRRNSIGA